MESFHLVYSIHVQASKAGIVGEECIGRVSVHNIFNPVRPINTYNVSQTAKMKGTVSSLLSRVKVPNLATEEQHGDNTCPISQKYLSEMNWEAVGININIK